jgi:hypothetical protein
MQLSSMTRTVDASGATAIALVGQTRTHARQATQLSLLMTKFTPA